MDDDQAAWERVNNATEEWMLQILDVIQQCSRGNQIETSGKRERWGGDGEERRKQCTAEEGDEDRRKVIVIDSSARALSSQGRRNKRVEVVDSEGVEVEE